MSRPKVVRIWSEDASEEFLPRVFVLAEEVEIHDEASDTYWKLPQRAILNVLGLAEKVKGAEHDDEV
jgi:hypothetical protein